MKKNFNKKKIIATLIGFSLCNNIFYVFNRNNFYLNISNIISLLGLIYIIFHEKNKVFENFKKIDNSFKMFLAACILSIIPACISFSDNLSVLSSYFNGLPSLFLLLIEYYVIVSFGENKNDIINGIKIGFIINLLVSILQYIYFIDGKIFTFFYNLFPTPSFQVCGKYYVLNSMSNITTTLKVYFYRAQGLFIETSYFTTFVAGAGLISIRLIKNKLFKIFSIVSLCYLCLMSESGNFMIFIIVVLLYYFITWLKKNSGKLLLKRKSLVYISIGIFLVSAGTFYAINNSELMKRINNTFLSTNISDAGNNSRKKTIDEGIELVGKYPLGIGYNMTSRIFKMEYPTEIHSYIFSTLIVNELELGFVGNIIYLVFALKFIIKILKYSDNEDDIAIAVSTLGLFICQATNGINYWNIQYILGMYGLANITYNDLKDKLMKNKNVQYIGGIKNENSNHRTRY